MSTKLLRCSGICLSPRGFLAFHRQLGPPAGRTALSEAIWTSENLPSGQPEADFHRTAHGRSTAPAVVKCEYRLPLPKAREETSNACLGGKIALPWHGRFDLISDGHADG